MRDLSDYPARYVPTDTSAASSVTPLPAADRCRRAVARTTELERRQAEASDARRAGRPGGAASAVQRAWASGSALPGSGR